MHSKALTSLRGFFQPILRFLGMTTTPPTELEFPHYFRVQDWETTLLEHYRSYHPELGPLIRSRMKTLGVKTICHFKKKEDAEHEYLVAEVYDPDLGRNRYLRIGRYVGDTFLHNHDTGRSISATSSNSSLVSKKFPATDYVEAVAEWPTDDICIVNLSCRDSQMIVLDLAIVAKVVHDYDKEYQVLTRQCYWYSGVIISVLQKSFSLKPGHGQDLATQFFPKKGGTYKSIPIYSEQRDMIVTICSLFETYKDEIYSSVNLLSV